MALGLFICAERLDWGGGNRLFFAFGEDIRGVMHTYIHERPVYLSQSRAMHSSCSC